MMKTVSDENVRNPGNPGSVFSDTLFPGAWVSLVLRMDNGG